MFCAQDKHRNNTFPTRRNLCRCDKELEANTNHNFVDNESSTADNVSWFFCLYHQQIFLATVSKTRVDRHFLSRAMDRKKNAKLVPSNPWFYPLDSNSIDHRTFCTNICKILRDFSCALLYSKSKRWDKRWQTCNASWNTIFVSLIIFFPCYIQNLFSS